MKMKWKALTGLAAVTLMVLAGTLYWAKTRHPELPRVSFLTLAGERIPSEALRGKVLLVNFWATSRTTCVKEMPQLVATHQQYAARGFETVAVAMSYDPPNYVAAFASSRRLPFKVALDPTGEVARAFGDIRLTPTTFLIDRKGRIVKRYLGEPDFQALGALVDKLLAAPA